MGQKGSKLNPMNLDDLKDQTQFTESDIIAYQKEFLQRYPKGKVSKEDIKKEYKRVFPDGDPVPFTDQLFSIYDTNHDGTLDFQEFLCGIGMMSHGTLEQKLNIAFRMYDLDSDGSISPWEMQSVITAIYKTIAPLKDKKGNNVPAAAAQAIFKSMDKDHDSKVTYEEFKDGVTKNADVVRLLEAMMK